MPLTDEQAALAAIATLETLSAEQQEAAQAIDAIVNDGKPFVDVHELFAHYNVLYFRKLLLPRVELLWSPRLTLCAGLCELSKDLTTGQLTRIRLKLSTPLLQYRPRPDTINTLLHEAIHAYFFITISWRHARDDDGTGHGIGFQLLSDAINNHGKYEITVFHTFHDEVESFRTHVWECDGPCRSQAPSFGLVKRSMNRAPGKSEDWWEQHQIECGGTFTKIQEPTPTKKQLENMSARARAGKQKNKLDGWVVAGVKTSPKRQGEPSKQPVDANVNDKSPRKPEDSKKKATVMSPKGVARSQPTITSFGIGQKRARPTDDDNEVRVIEKKLMVECPICPHRVAESEINEHLDVVHPPSFQSQVSTRD